jgi:predicted O-methyltransferase YrrM
MLAMDADRRAFLDRLYAEGTAHDDAEPDRLKRLRNLEPDAAELLTQLLRIADAKQIVEIGTSNGYSAIWLADAAQDTGGRVVSVDLAGTPDAIANLGRSGVTAELLVADGGAFLSTMPDDSVDLLLLDAERTEYPAWWPHPARVVRPGGVLAADNVLSHPDEVAPFLQLVRADDAFVSSTVDVGKGLFVAWKRLR